VLIALVRPNIEVGLQTTAHPSCAPHTWPDLLLPPQGLAHVISSSILCEAFGMVWCCPSELLLQV
jgi:hypothetical protein